MGLGLVLRCCRVVRWGAGGAGTDGRLMASLVLLLDRVVRMDAGGVLMVVWGFCVHVV